MATTAHSIRFDEDLWGYVTAQAEREGVTPSEIVRRVLSLYFAGPLRLPEAIAQPVVKDSESIDDMKARVDQAEKATKEP